MTIPCDCRAVKRLPGCDTLQYSQRKRRQQFAVDARVQHTRTVFVADASRAQFCLCALIHHQVCVVT